MLTPLFQGKKQMRIAALMSGSGTNLERILEHKTGAYKVVVILTDNKESNARKIAEKHRIPYEENDINAFYEAKGKPKKDLSVRAEFDAITLNRLQKYVPDAIAYCGYMSIASPVLVNSLLGVNVHPADLSVLDEKRKRKFTGGNAVRDAILAGEKTIRSTTHIVEEAVDGGRLLMRSKPVKVELPEGFDKNNMDQLNAATKSNQDRLKREGDWVIFPLTLQYIAEKRFAQDELGRIHFDGKAVPDGVICQK